MDQLKNEISEFDKTVDEFVTTLSQFTQEEINKVPFKGSWTAGQVGRHILKALGGAPELFMYGEVKETERAPDEKVKAIDGDFLNFNVKFKSPEFIIPENVEYNKEELINSLKEVKEKTVEVAKTKDLSLTSLAFEMPVYGFLTLYELIHFSKVHTIRHNRQLKNIQEKLANKVEVN